MRKILIWFLMLWKRLLVKKGFLIILAVIPISVFLFTMSANKDNGFMNVAVALDAEADIMAEDFISRLSDDTDTFKYHFCKDKEAAVKMVESGKADSAWIVPGKLKDAVERYAENGNTGRIVTIYQREENVFQKLSREKIYCTIYPYISLTLYSNYTAGQFLTEAMLTPQELEEAYRVYETDESIIDYRYDESVEEKMVNTGYLTSPIRGIAVILMLLCGLASTMYFLTDEEERTFTLLPVSRRVFVMAASNLAALITSGLFVTPALVMSGNYTDVMTETLSMAVYILCTTAFCTLLGSIISRIRVFGLVLPVITVACIGFCPVFIQLIDIPWIQMLLPPYHYLNSIYYSEYILYMTVYVVIAMLVACPVYAIVRKISE